MGQFGPRNFYLAAHLRLSLCAGALLLVLPLSLVVQWGTQGHPEPTMLRARTLTRSQHAAGPSCVKMERTSVSKVHTCRADALSVPQPLCF